MRSSQTKCGQLCSSCVPQTLRQFTTLDYLKGGRKSKGETLDPDVEGDGGQLNRNKERKRDIIERQAFALCTYSIQVH